MKANCLVFAAILCAAASAQTQTSGDARVPLTVMTFNIRYGTAPDGDNAWDKRKDLLVETVRLREPDILGTQEGLDFQLDYIQQQLGDNYRRFGAPRDPNSTGEHCAVFYRRDRLEPIETGDFWLSETPDQPGTKSWGAHHNRIATWARFRHLATGRTLVYFNTHLDNGSEDARREGARLLAERIKSTSDGAPAILTGDFNSAAESSAAWTLLMDAGLADTRGAVPSPGGPVTTFNGFRPMPEVEGARIDWILVSPQFDVKSCETITHNRDGRFPSDHFPVVAKLDLP